MKKQTQGKYAEWQPIFHIHEKTHAQKRNFNYRYTRVAERTERKVAMQASFEENIQYVP